MGEFSRCAQMTYHDSDEYCYYHTKQIYKPGKHDTTPAPYREDDPERVVAYYKKGDMEPLVVHGKRLTNCSG